MNNSKFKVENASFFRVVTTIAGSLCFQVSPAPAGHLLQVFDEENCYKSQIVDLAEEGQIEAEVKIMAIAYREIVLGNDVKITRE